MAGAGGPAAEQVLLGLQALRRLSAAGAAHRRMPKAASSSLALRIAWSPPFWVVRHCSWRMVGCWAPGMGCRQQRWTVACWHDLLWANAQQCPAAQQPATQRTVMLRC